MKTQFPQYPWIDPHFQENQAKFPPEELLRKYGGQYIAWSWDGTTVLASAETRERLDEKLLASGYDLSRVVHDYVDAPEITCLL